MSFDKDVVLIEKKTGKKYKILAIRNQWIDFYALEDGTIITKCTETLDDFDVIIPKPEFTETSQIETGEE